MSTRSCEPAARGGAPRRPQRRSAAAVWRQLTAAPHRILFFCGMLQLLAAMAWWLANLLGRYGGLYTPPVLAAPPGWAHGYLMIFGTLPFFIFGFLMTAMPNWLGEGRVPRPAYLACAGLMAAGVAAFYAAVAISPWLAAAAVLVQLAGWIVGWVALARLSARAARPERRYPAIMLSVTAVGAALLAAFAVGVARLDPAWVAAALRGGLWWFLLPVFFNVSHRMIPFFSSRALPGYPVIRPPWTVPMFTAGSLLRGVLELAGSAPALLLVADGLMLLPVAYLTARWRGWRAGGVRLLAVLHLGFAMLAVALVLFLVQDVAALRGHAVLGHAPAHALTIGYFSAMLVAMVSRVTLGHSGRPLEADAVIWGCFLAVLATAALRIAAELPGVPAEARAMLMWLAALAWLLALLPWVVAYLPVYLAPRVDGRPG
ncbi:MAG: NnrS family protein [Pseudomonadota bacterium]